MPSSTLKITIQACILSATSNLIAQTLNAYRNNAPYTIDWIAIFQFVLFAAISAPPNFLWQTYLESAFPADYMVPSPSAIRAASKNDEKELDHEQKTHSILEPKLHIQNTLTKFVLDQTLGASINTLMFSLVYAGFRGATYANAIAAAQKEFWPTMRAGWTVWPLVSLLSFSVLKTAESRGLVGGLAGLGWGIYLSLTKA